MSNKFTVETVYSCVGCFVLRLMNNRVFSLIAVVHQVACEEL